jgi:hypothetical protein
MIGSLGMIGLLVQAAAHPLPARSTPAPDPVRVWRADSTAYLQLRKPGHVALLHVDAIGRIQVLYPLIPEDTFAVSNESPVAIALPPTAEANPATFVAVWSRWPFDFAAIQAGSDWNYDALLMQPTAGDPLAALLDISDRVTDGRPYEYSVVEYSRSGTMAVGRQPLAPTVCLSCVRRGTAVAAAPAPIPSNAVDCSNASLTNSFCGVNSGSVSITSVPQTAYQPPPAAAPAAVYVPYYVPLFVHGGRSRFERPMAPPPIAPRPSFGAAFPIAPRLVVPSGSDVRSFTGRRH